MQSKVYRFEIVRALANAVFEAKDPVDGSTVFLYEWTPAPGDRDAARKRLAELAEELKCEVFTADASLYVSAGSRLLGHDALNTLRAQGLFPGEWLDDPPTLPPPPPPVIAPQPQPPKPRSWGGIVVLLLAAALLAYMGGCYAGNSQAEADAQARINSTRNSLEAEKNQLQEQLNNQSTAAKGASGALATYSGTQLIRVKNECRLSVRVAVSFVDFNRQRVVKGWTEIGTGATSILAASPSPDFGIYAEDANGDGGYWAAESGTAIGVTAEDFIYLTNSGLSGDTVRKVYPLSLHVDGPGYTENLQCPKK